MGSTTVPPHTCASLTVAVQSVMGRELARYAVREGRKKISMMEKSDWSAKNVEEISAGLVTAIAATVDSQRAMTEKAAAFLFTFCSI